MPETNEKPDSRPTTTWGRGIARQARMLSLQRISYVGNGLIRLRAEERKLWTEWVRLDKECPEITQRIPARCQLVKAFDQILDRRRILCGDPLPSSKSGKAGPKRMLELEPMPIQESVPEPPQAGPSLEQ